MKEGIRRLTDGHPVAAADALSCFDQALSLRRQLPLADRPDFRYGLAACWVNRADALARLGGAAQLEAALRAYDETIVLMRTLPLDDDVRYPRRLAIASQNRGLALRALGVARTAEALHAFEETIALLEAPCSVSIPDRQWLLAATWTNLAQSHAALGDPRSLAQARTAAHRALSSVEQVAVADVECAEVALRARHVLCQLLARQLSDALQQGDSLREAVHEATDMADDGLRLVQAWERRGIAKFRGLACDLFRFGARVYAIYQPHFLDEFVRDNLDASQSSIGYVDSPEMRAAALETLAWRGQVSPAAG